MYDFSIDLNIECTVCGRLRRSKFFSKKTLRTEKNVCKFCIQNKMFLIRQGRRNIKVRCCLRCEKKFISKNNFRICPNCHSTDDYKYNSGLQEHKLTKP